MNFGAPLGSAPTLTDLPPAAVLEAVAVAEGVGVDVGVDVAFDSLFELEPPQALTPSAVASATETHVRWIPVRPVIIARDTGGTVARFEPDRPTTGPA